MIEIIGGPDRDRTDDLFHAMEARSQLRHRPTSWWGQLSYFRRSGSIRQTRAISISKPRAHASHQSRANCLKEAQQPPEDSPF
jgi:hypothetical protein